MITSNPELVIEIILEEDPLWPGNQIYKNDDGGAYSRFCAEQDYIEHYYPGFSQGDVDEDAPGIFTWEFIGKGVYYLYEDGVHIGVQQRWRPIHSLDK